MGIQKQILTVIKKFNYQKITASLFKSYAK